MAVSSSHNSISLEASISDLTSDVFVGTSHNHTILGCIVLVLVLDDKALTGIIVGLAFTSPPKLHLVTLEISFTFDHFDKRLQKRNMVKSSIILEILELILNALHKNLAGTIFKYFIYHQNLTMMDDFTDTVEIRKFLGVQLQDRPDRKRKNVEQLIIITCSIALDVNAIFFLKSRNLTFPIWCVECSYLDFSCIVHKASLKK